MSFLRIHAAVDSDGSMCSATGAGMRRWAPESRANHFEPAPLHLVLHPDLMSRGKGLKTLLSGEPICGNLGGLAACAATWDLQHCFHLQVMRGWRGA